MMFSVPLFLSSNFFCDTSNWNTQFLCLVRKISLYLSKIMFAVPFKCALLCFAYTNQCIQTSTCTHIWHIRTLNASTGFYTVERILSVCVNVCVRACVCVCDCVVQKKTMEFALDSIAKQLWVSAFNVRFSRLPVYWINPHKIIDIKLIWDR